MSEIEELFEKQLSSQEVYHGRLLHVFKDDIELPDGRSSTREYVKHVGAVCMVAVTADGNVIMERQFRYPVGRVISEIPAGKLDSPYEDRLEAAKRELQEETGITGDNWVEMGHFISTPAFTEEDISMYLVTGLHQGERNLDDGEFINVFEAPLESLIVDVMNGKIADGKTQAALLKAYMLLKQGHSENKI